MWGCVCLKEVCREEVMGSFLEEQVEICLPGVCVCVHVHAHSVSKPDRTACAKAERVGTRCFV